MRNQDYQEPQRDYDDLNKSDSEKVLAKKLGSVNFRTDDLDILYNARGKEIDKLQKQLAEARAEFEEELRAARHQLALARSENHNSAGDLEQLQRVVGDTRRENKVLTEEIHTMNLRVKQLAEENELLQAEKESSSNIIQQLQLQLSQLQTNDSVLKARHQHDATVRYASDRTSAVKRSISSTTGCTITEKAPTRHYAKRAMRAVSQREIGSATQLS